MYLWQRPRDVQELGRGALARGSDPQHVGELPGGDLDTDAGEEPDQDGPGQEIRQESEPGQPGQQQQPAREQGHESGQPDVLLRASDREPGQGRAEYGRGGGVSADNEMAR